VFSRSFGAQIAASLVVGAAAAALAGACGDSSSTTSNGLDSGQETSSVTLAECPPAEPTNGSVCLLPEGTTCDFGQCGTRLAQCTRGTWRLGANAAPNPPCPADPPSTDMKCPACWPAKVKCTYGSTDCSAADASVNTAIASCPNGTWLLDIRPCRDGGGPDVQGDGGADAD
jgi:hypothetical protein